MIELHDNIAWILLVVALSFATFGVVMTVSYLASIIVFILGGVTLFYVKEGEKVQQYLSKIDDTCEIETPGLYQVMELILKRNKKTKTDCRLTGSQVIDEQIHDILSFIIRDYIYPWYDLVSANDDFPHQIRITAHKMIVTFSNRMKEVDWISYLTTRMVDDAASHLRLFRQARAKMKQGSTNGGGSAAVTVGHRRQHSGEFPIDLESAFFDLELTMEKNLICRDHICLDNENGKGYLQEVSEVLLFLLMPEEDFHCIALRHLIRELFVNSILLPLFDRFSDPDYINQTIVWLFSDTPITSEVFLTALRVSDNLEELQATRDLINKEISVLRSRDSGGDDDTWVKQQLSSLMFVGKIIDSQIARLNEGSDSDSVGLPSHIDYSKLLAPGVKLFALPLDVLLKNNVALSFFIDYMTSIGCQAYLNLYLNIEGWRVSAEQQLSDIVIQKIKHEDSVEKGIDATCLEDHISSEQLLESMREAAYSIFETYLSDKASSRIKIDELLIKKLLLRIRTETPHETWFDEVQEALFEKLKLEEKFLAGFRKDVLYVKLLAELELLKDNETGSKSDEDDTGSIEENSNGSETASLSSLNLDITKDGSLSRAGSQNYLPVSPATYQSHPSSPSHGINHNNSIGPKQGPFTLHAKIIETGLVTERGKTFGIYAVSVTKKYESGHQENWHIYRRYSDFYELHQKIREKFPDLSKQPFPGKKTFKNMDRKVLEKRMQMINEYLRMLLLSSVIISHPNLLSMLLSFFEPGEYDKGVTVGNISKTLDTLLVNPFRAVTQGVGQAVRTMPDNLISTMDGMMDGLSKVLQYGGVNKLTREDSSDCEAIKVGASLDTESDENIPLRIILLLMTEVFELKSRNQWLRKRIVTLLRQIIRTMFGDIVNRRILDYVFLMTSPDQVAEYLKNFKHSYWPHGLKSEPRLPRDESIRARTRVAAKVALLSSISDEFKHILGSETTRKGLLSVFTLFQNPILNRRLLFVLFEGILITMFSHDHPFNNIFQKLHSRSPRVSKNILQRPRR